MTASTRRNSRVDSVLLLDKKAGVTSFDALRPAKRVLGRHTGHAGTLDRFASGLLIVFSGRCTRLCDLFMGLPKVYSATIVFGLETDPLDPDGMVIATGPVPSFERVKQALSGFAPFYMQSPPGYSAVHLDGQRAWKLARSGRQPEIPPRPVCLHDYEINGWEDGQLQITLKVSKGFYVRSFARDLALKCSSYAHVGALRRTAIGPFDVGDAVPSDDEDAIIRSAGGFVLEDVLARLGNCVFVEADARQARLLGNGVLPHSLESQLGEGLTVFTHQGRVGSVLDRDGHFVWQGW